jgi:hypothetical protein
MILLKASIVSIKNREIDRMVVQANKRKGNLNLINYSLRVMMKGMIDRMQFSATFVVI